MLTCVYSAESFKTKAVTVKLRQAGGKAKKKAKLLAIKERPGVAKPDPTVNANHGVSYSYFSLNVLLMRLLCSQVFLYYVQTFLKIKINYLKNF